MMRAMSSSSYLPVVWWASAAVLGWCVGLALRHWAHALPLRLEAAWRQHAQALYGMNDPAPLDASAHALPPTPGSSRWMPWATSVVYALCAYQYGLTGVTLATFVYCGALITLAAIDAQTRLLPDCITLPLLWLGLLLNTAHIWTSPEGAVFGAALGYGVLWLLFHLFRRVTGKDGMGHGDFKLTAAMGAWLGWHDLPVMLLAASALGVMGAMVLRWTGRAAPGEALPFGPYLAGVGIAAILWPVLTLG